VRIRHDNAVLAYVAANKWKTRGLVLEKNRRYVITAMYLHYITFLLKY